MALGQGAGSVGSPAHDAPLWRGRRMLAPGHVQAQPEPFAHMSCWGSSWQKNFPPNKVLTVQPSPASNEPGVDFPPCQPRALSIPVLPSPLCCQLIFFNFLFFFLSSLLDGAVVKALNNRLHLSGARQPASWRQFSLLIHFQGS